MAGASIPGSKIKVVGSGIKIAMGGGLSSGLPAGLKRPNDGEGFDAPAASKARPPPPGMPQQQAWGIPGLPAMPGMTIPPPPSNMASGSNAGVLAIPPPPGGLAMGGVIGALPPGGTIGPPASGSGELPQGGRIGEVKTGGTIGPPKAEAEDWDWYPDDNYPSSSSQPALHNGEMSIADQIANLASMLNPQAGQQIPASTADALLGGANLLQGAMGAGLSEQQMAAAQLQMMAQQEMSKAGEELQQLQAIQMQQLAAQYAAAGGAPSDEAPQGGYSEAVSAEISAAQQAQYLQQCQFQAQVRQFEADRNQGMDEIGRRVSSTVSRFKNGFRPIQLCQKLFKMGNCFRGDDCTFAHALDELHPASPDLPTDFSSGGHGTTTLAEQTDKDDFTSQVPTMRMKKKREMCHRLTRGGCLLGKKCMFAHDETELGTVCLVITDRVKTAICKHWESGKCIYGKYCVNAHGMDEIGLLKPPEDLCPPSNVYKKFAP